jgi:hypothetical protein
MSGRRMQRAIGATAFAALAAVILGCMSLSIAERSATTSMADTDVLAQEGTFAQIDAQSKVVYYPIPYASPPNLEFTAESESRVADVEILEQKEDHFRFRVPGGSSGWVKWKARGLRRPAGTVPTPPDAAPTSELPDRPAPVEKPNG